MTDFVAQVCVRVLVPFGIDTTADTADQKLAKAATVAEEAVEGTLGQKLADIAVAERTQELVEVKRGDAGRYAETDLAAKVCKQLGDIGEIAEVIVEEVRER